MATQPIPALTNSSQRDVYRPPLQENDLTPADFPPELAAAERNAAKSFARHIGTRQDYAIEVVPALVGQTKVFERLFGCERRSYKQLCEFQRIRNRAEAKALSEAKLLRQYLRQSDEESDKGETKVTGGLAFPIR